MRKRIFEFLISGQKYGDGKIIIRRAVGYGPGYYERVYRYTAERARRLIKAGRDA